MDLLEMLASEARTINVQEQQGGANGCHNTVNQNNVSANRLQTTVARYEAHVMEPQFGVMEQQEMNKRLLVLLEKQMGG